MKDITDADYIHAKRLCQDLKKQKNSVNIMICISKVIYYF